MMQEFGEARMRSISSSVESYLPFLLQGDVEGLAGLFGNTEPLVNDVREGRVEGRPGLERLVESTTKWLAGKRAYVQHLRTTNGPKRSISEEILHIDLFGKKIELPVGVLALKNAAGAIIAIHVYHTLWPLKHKHTVREAFVEPDPNAEHTGVVLSFVKNLGVGDIAGALQMFEPDLYLREASGPPFVHWGTADVASYFVGLFAPGAPMIKKYTVTDDGRCAVMEFAVVGWAGKAWPREQHQAGLAVYERGESGLLRAIRIYDDVAF